MIEVTSSVKIDENEIQLDFIRASGPGGQNVNKVATSVQLRFDVRNSPSLEPEVKERLARLAGSRMTEDGILIIQAKQYRTQEQNRQAAISRLVNLVRKATEKPRPRHATQPTYASKQRRLDKKRHHSRLKQLRQIQKEE